jgi:uncharacterized protein YjbI with pentapeptide repeats
MEKMTIIKPHFCIFLFLINIFVIQNSAQTKWEYIRNRTKLELKLIDRTQFPTISKEDFEARAIQRYRNYSDDKTPILFEVKIPAQFLIEFLINNKKPGTIRIQNCYIEGKFDLHNVKVNNSVDFISTEFDEIVFDGVTFTDRVMFEFSSFSDLKVEKTKFEDEVYFVYSDFFGSVTFKGVQFSDSVDFSNAKFYDTYVVKTDAQSHIINAPFETDFENCVFSKQTKFNDAQFERRLMVDNSKFERNTSFEGIDFFEGFEISDTSFEDLVSFKESKFGPPVYFARVTFSGFTIFDDVQPKVKPLDIEIGQIKNNLSFHAVTFKANASFNGLTMDYLDFSSADYKSEYRLMKDRPVLFEKAVSFRKMKIARADFEGAEFQDVVDFSYTAFQEEANFKKTTFRENVDCYKTEFPKPRKYDTDSQPVGTYFDNSRFLKSIQIEWKQLGEGQLETDDVATWENFEQAFKTAGNQKGQTETQFKKLYYKREDVWDNISYYFWGFSLRPSWLFGWIVAFNVVFIFLYWTQTKSITYGVNLWEGKIKRFIFAIKFAWRTSYKLNYGVENSRTPFFKVVTFVHANAMKILLLLLLIAIANISPLLKEILGKILPI